MVRILILGGGFGGVRTAIDLERRLRKEILAKDTEIILIDKNGYHLFTAALYEVASASGVDRDPFSVKLRKTVCLPYGDIFEDRKIKFIQAEISEVNLNEKWVTTHGGEKFGFDHLVLGLGSQSSDFGIPGVNDYSYKFKTLEDALMVHDKIELMVTDAANQKRALPINILIVGAGFTGIELAAELACCVKSIAKKCRLSGKCSQITLFEAGPKILPMVLDRERSIITKRLTHHGVVIMENSAIEEVSMDYVQLKIGQKVQGDLVIWTAGVKPNEFLKTIQGLTLTDKGRISVDSNLRVNNLENVFAVGDVIEFIDPATKKPVPGMAFTAYNQGKVVALNISNKIKGKKMKDYVPHYNVWTAPVGGKYAVAHSGSRSISGFWGWVARELIDLRYMLSIFPFVKALKIFWEEITIFTKNDN